MPVFGAAIGFAVNMPVPCFESGFDRGNERIQVPRIIHQTDAAPDHFVSPVAEQVGIGLVDPNEAGFVFVDTSIANTNCIARMLFK